MKRVFKFLILIVSVIVVMYLGLVIWLNYNEKKNIIPVTLKADVNFIVTRINNYCAAEEMKVQMGTITERICDENDKIINNILTISNIGLFEKILALNFDGQVQNIELQYKDFKYIYRINNRDIIVTDINDNSYDYKEEVDDNVGNVTDDNKDDNENVPEDNEDDFESSEQENGSVVVDKIVVNDELVKSLYNKYISYNMYETNNYKNINVNDSSSDEYLVKHSIYKILEDNKVNIKNYVWSSSGDTYASFYGNGYKITTSQINDYIKTNFNVQRTIDFKNLKLDFVLSGNELDIAYYYNVEENAYRILSNSSIPATGAGNIIKYSKYNNHEKNGDELIIYTDFFLVGNDMGLAFLNNNMDNVNAVITTLGDISNIDVDYVLNNHNNKIGKFKHVFKKVDGNYYWVSTKQTN